MKKIKQKKLKFFIEYFILTFNFVPSFSIFKYFKTNLLLFNMKMKILFFTGMALFTLVFFTVISCDSDENENETVISKYGLTKSHNIGQNCMDCHKSGGNGEGWFTAAGTVYDSNGVTPNPNATINLYSGANGTGNIIMTIEVDAKGNFYTTESIDFSDNNIHPSVTAFTGKTKFMPGIPGTGQCNSCHGISVPRIWVN